MTQHLFGTILTPEGVASNNRGENAGNVSTLQKLLRRGETYTTVSAEAIRYALRELWASTGNEMNRKIDGDGTATWADVTFENWRDHIDDDVLGFMDPKKDTVKRRGRLELSRAISTRPWSGDVMFNVASPGAHPKNNKDPVPYAVEVHCTRYQYTFGLTPDALHDRSRALIALDALADIHRVAGNHGRYLFQFAPEAVVLRVTEDPVPRLMYCFDESEDGVVSADKLVSALKSGDVDPSEIVTGGQPLGSIASTLRDLGASVHEGVKQAFREVRGRLESPA